MKLAPSSNAPDPAPGGHVPVLLAEVLASLGAIAGKRVVDGTFGAGGYARALLEAGAQLCAIDRDPAAGRYADPLRERFSESFQFVAGRFSQLDSLCGTAADAVVLDIGVSSMQLDEASRGFSFQREGPLDMRMSGEGVSAADLVNTLDERDLAGLIGGLGEERRARAVARAIVAARPLETTLELARVVAGVVRSKPGGIHPATRTFQALRIAVNAEFRELVEGLFAAERLLAAGGTLCVVSFHSLEDRIVKRFLSPPVAASRHRPQAEVAPAAWQPRRPLRPGADEIAANPRARSATLRSGVRSQAPPRPVSFDGLGVPGAALGSAPA